MKDFNYYLNLNSEIGFVEEATNAIVYVSGLPKVKPEEIVVFETGVIGIVLSFTKEVVEILFFSQDSVRHGTRVTRTNEFLNIPVSMELLGNIINSLGNPINPQMRFKTTPQYRGINNIASGILTRKTITRQFETGIPIVDLIMPLGFGQREVIIGDRKTGKTNFLMQSILAQAKSNNICVYAAIGKKRLDIKDAEEFFRKNNIFNRIVIVASGLDDPIGLTYLAPFTAMTISEYLRDEGNDVFLVLDDLTTHAKFYREISLLAKRFPGRNSYPGDIFYTHAKILERAGNFATKKGEHAITCFPVAETIQGDFSGYIQTNVMSMTDGHLYFDSELFAKGRRPAMNPFLSVTRVGRQTQSTLKKDINRELLSFLTIYEKMQNFTHFGAELNESIKATLSFGEKVTKFLDQTSSSAIPLNLQIILFCILWGNIQRNKEVLPVDPDMEKMINKYNTSKEVNKLINDLIANAESFNRLLKTIGERGEDILRKLKS